MQCQSKEKDAKLEKEIRDIVSVVESSDFQFGTQHVEDSALLYVSGYISRCLLRSVKFRTVVNCYAKDRMLWGTVVIHIFMT